MKNSLKWSESKRYCKRVKCQKKAVGKRAVGKKAFVGYMRMVDWWIVGRCIVVGSMRVEAQ